MPIEISHDETTLETRLAVEEEEVVERAETMVHGKELIDETLFPLVMQHVKRSWLLEAALPASNDRFCVKINGTDYSELPTSDSKIANDCYGDTRVLSVGETGELKFNGIEIVEEDQSLEWSLEAMESRLI